MTGWFPNITIKYVLVLTSGVALKDKRRSLLKLSGEAKSMIKRGGRKYESESKLHGSKFIRHITRI